MLLVLMLLFGFVRLRVESDLYVRQARSNPILKALGQGVSLQQAHIVVEQDMSVDMTPGPGLPRAQL